MLPNFVSVFVIVISSPITHPELLWVLIPVYINWIIGDIYQEHKGTHIGNAISNGFVALWVGLDWGRQITQNFVLSSETPFKIAMIGFLIMYGLTVLIEGIRGKDVARYIGRVREVTYVIIFLTPIFYGIIPISLDTLISALVFFPIYYILIEILMRITPSPSE